MPIAHPYVRFLFAAIWLVNGLYCKVLGLVPRHEQIVGAILGDAHAGPLTVAIGVAEMGMAAWIVTGWRYRLCAGVQIAVIGAMNVLEFLLVPHLLLWGRLNALFALGLMLLIYLHAFAKPTTVDRPLT